MAQVFSEYQFGYGVCLAERMRVRIIKSVAGVLDGQSLARFAPGLVYDIDDALARQLISMGGAREELSEHPALVIPVNDERLDEARLTGGVRVIPPETAHDHPNEPSPDRRRNLADRRKRPRTDRRKAAPPLR
jgi:hypothetical protein